MKSLSAKAPPGSRYRPSPGLVPASAGTFVPSKRCTVVVSCYLSSAVIDTPQKVAQREGMPQKVAPMVAPVATMEDLSPSNFEGFLVGSGPNTICAVMFSGEHCGACKLMQPEFSKMASIYPSFKFGYFNCSESPEHKIMATQSRVRSIPTFRVYQGGRGLEETTGARPVQLRQMLLHYFRPADM